jgi:hypothetical protein
MVRLCLLGDDRWGEIYDGLKNSFYGIDSYVADNQIKLTFSPEDIRGSTCFDFVVLVRKYGNKGAPDALLIFDKAPGEGHFRFEEGSVTYIPRVSALPNLPNFLILVGVVAVIPVIAIVIVALLKRKPKSNNNHRDKPQVSCK